MKGAPVQRSSGNFLADRRYEYARAAAEDGDHAAAADLARQTLELVPDFAPARALLGRALAALGRRDEAVDEFGRVLAIEPEDTLGVRIDLARLGAAAPEDAVGPAYVRALFDDYAPRFDRHLVQNLNYRGPALIADALRRVCAAQVRPFRFRRMLDLGCGTGLMARALDGRFEAAEGVDLSPRMLALARRTRLYAALHEADLVAFLLGQDGGSADLVVAADVFVYLADLGPAFSATHRVLERRGLFAFTVQAHAGEGVVLGDDARYAHGEASLRDLADRAGFTVAAFERVSTREDRGEPVPGFLLVLERG
ncbi:MAG TPA: methyltransferase domain-containing protein [Beijerinckiaceae bacterium]|nr:methyltransferase domain-containing protein [Beijerinckiaceae bacterium]